MSSHPERSATLGEALPLKIHQLIGWAAIGTIAFVLGGCEAIAQFPLSQLPLPALRSSPVPETPPQSEETLRIETQVLQEINQIRQEQGFSELRPNDRLSMVARRYSQRMAKENFFAHVSPTGDSVSERVQSAGIFYIIVGENLFKVRNARQDITSLAVEGWMNSPGHRENILYPEYRESGVGVWREGNTVYVTQLFRRWL